MSNALIITVFAATGSILSGLPVFHPSWQFPFAAPQFLVSGCHAVSMTAASITQIAVSWLGCIHYKGKQALLGCFCLFLALLESACNAVLFVYQYRDIFSLLLYRLRLVKQLLCTLFEPSLLLARTSS